MTEAASPFHAGEQAIQTLAGVRDRMERKGRAIIRDYMPEQHREFFAALSFMVVGLADQNGHPWATALSGPPGFMSSASEHLLTIRAWPDPSDPLRWCIKDGVPIGALGIELSTRRRNRLNGRIKDCIVSEGFSIGVQQSFGNCPKYIQARNEQPRLDFSRPLDAERRRILAMTRWALSARPTHSSLHPDRRSSTRWHFRKVSTSPTAADFPALYG